MTIGLPVEARTELESRLVMWLFIDINRGSIFFLVTRWHSFPFPNFYLPFRFLQGLSVIVLKASQNRFDSPSLHCFIFVRMAFSVKPWLLLSRDSLCDASCYITLRAICDILAGFVAESNRIFFFFLLWHPIHCFLPLSAWYHYWISDQCHL